MANLEQSTIDGVTVLRLGGSLTHVELATLERAFRAAVDRAGPAVVIDLADVDFLTTPAISMFLVAAKTKRGTGGRIMVTGPQPRVGEVLKRLRLDVLLPVAPSVEEGVARLKQA